MVRTIFDTKISFLLVETVVANHVKQNYLTINGKGVAWKTPIDLLQCSSVQWVYEAKS
jgi:hypothetical protein